MTMKILNDLELGDYAILYGCSDLNGSMIEVIRKSTYYCESDSYSRKFYTKDKILIAEIRVDDRVLELYNGKIRIDPITEYEISEHLYNLETKRVKDLNEAFVYLDSLSLKKSFIDYIKLDAFVVEEWMLGDDIRYSFYDNEYWELYTIGFGEFEFGTSSSTSNGPFVFVGKNNCIPGKEYWKWYGSVEYKKKLAKKFFDIDDTLAEYDRLSILSKSLYK